MKGDNLVITRAREQDALPITRAQIASWTEAYAHFIPREFFATLSVEARAKRWTELIAADAEDVYVLRDDSELAGFIHFRTVVEAEGSKGKIERLYLAPSYWGNGYGTQMMNFALSEFAKTKVSKIDLWVAEENKRARKFYEAFDFRFTGIRRASKYSVDGSALAATEKPDINGVLDPSKGEMVEVSYSRTMS